MNWDIQLARTVHTHRSSLPETIRTLGEAVDMIDEDLPESLRVSSGWQAVKGMLVTAAETRTGRAVEAATASLEKALENEGWLSR
jgi:hypothetical protein